MEILHEQERQERIAGRIERDVEKEQHRLEQMTRVLGLSSDEQGRLAQLFSTMQAGRKRVVEEMRGGGKSAEQARDEIDKLEEGTDQSVRALLGDERLRKYREARRSERRGGPGGQQAVPAASQ
jgi:hypothetical protein